MKKLGKQCLAYLMATTMFSLTCFTGCSNSSSSVGETNAVSTAAEQTQGSESTSKDAADADTSAAETTEEKTAADETTAEETKEEAQKDPNNYVELALNVMFNDADHNYYERENGESIIVTDDGQYTLSFDCSENLSDKAVDAGISSLTNLTAIYILDLRSTKGEQAPISACNIKYDSVVVDDTELTITKTDAKSALKNTGVFDTNDPINSWEGSAVEEAVCTSEHVANFTTLEDPQKITVTFTLSDMAWGTDAAGNNDGEAASENTYVNEAAFSSMDFTDMDAVEFTKYMGNGINLGNTMEAVNANAGKNSDPTIFEQSWGQPITTKAIIVGMKNCGFDTIRIPVAWTNVMDYENDNYDITPYLDRVQQIVDWAIEAEMFVIVNDHWDNGWWSMFAGDEKEEAKAWKIYEEMWKQISERFKDYSDMLILESANEELGSGWLNKGMEEDETYVVMNKINQKFVDIVRAAGGNNDDRFLLIAGNNTNIDKTLDDRFIMPEDTAKNKLIVSVHYYDPWNYCGDKKADSPEELDCYRWGLKEEYEYMEKQLGKMSKFTDAGYGVIIGEYGALPAYVNGTSYQIPNTVEYTENFLDVCDLNDFCPVLWSTNDSYNKATRSMISKELLDVFTSHCYAEEAAQGDDYKKNVESKMKEAYEAAPEKWEGLEEYEPGTPVAWIMWNGGAGTYSVGDKFNASDNTAGITATNTVVDGAGEYTVSLDFAGGNTGLTFSALAIADGETLYPGAVIKIKELTLDGTPVELGKYYTTSDDGKCMRVNIYNGWCGNLQKQIEKGDCAFRTEDGDLSDITATPLDPTLLAGTKNLTITFELITK